MEVKVICEPALTSQILRLDVSGSGGAQVTAIAPTPIPTNTAQLEPTVQPTPVIVPTPSVVETRVRSFGVWLAGLMVLIGLVILFYQVGARRVSVRWGVRMALLTALFGSLGLVIFGLTPSGLAIPDIWNSILFAGVGGLFGNAISWAWCYYPRWISGKPE
jgi:hypothetical protein